VSLQATEVYPYHQASDLLIINADDFGRDESTNFAILGSFKYGFCSSTTIMANMPGFDQARDIAREHGLLNHIGLHLVLRDGYPLSDRIRRCRRFCDQDGRLALSWNPPLLYPDWEEKRALAEEIRSQIKQCRKAGVPVTHLDSHYHMHTQWGVLQVVIPVAREQGIASVRLARNCGQGISPVKKTYKTIVNFQLARAGLARTRYFGAVEDYVSHRQTARTKGTHRSIEVMVHPMLDAEGIVVDDQRHEALSETISSIDGYLDAVSFLGNPYPVAPKETRRSIQPVA
jgi:predicted glycoside hydrolase/deacetylase ChbG (UPF0249 family)